MQLFQRRRRVRAENRGRQRRGEELERFIRQTDHARSQERRGRQLRFGPREKRQQREHVLDLVGVEEPEALVDVERHTAARERLLEQAMALTRPKQHGDVARAGGAPDAAVAIAHGGAGRQQPRNLLADRLGLRFIGRRRHETQRVALPCLHRSEREHVVFAVPEGVRPLAPCR